MYLLHGFFTQNTMKTLYVLEELGVAAWFERLEERDSTARARAQVQSYQQTMMAA